MNLVLDKLLFFPALEKEDALQFLLLLTVERGLGSSGTGEGDSWQGGLGEAESGDTHGVRTVEQVKFKAGADLSAAVKVQNKHRCSNSWLQKLHKAQKVTIYTLFYIMIYS